jgi:hypothetical protein
VLRSNDEAVNHYRSLSLVALLVSSCATSAPGDDVVRILFIGNSLTYWNEMPATFCRAAKSAGRRVECAVIAFPDHDLGDHLERGDAAKRIRAERWTWVVLQQGPSAAPASRARLVASVTRFAEIIKPTGARIAVFAAWPQRSRRGDFDRALQSAVLAADAAGATVLPVSAAWQKVWARDASVPLYAADGLHPSLAGSYVTALVLHGVIFGDLPDSRAVSSEALQITAEQLAIIRDAAQLAPLKPPALTPSPTARRSRMIVAPHRGPVAVQDHPRTSRLV